MRVFLMIGFFLLSQSMALAVTCDDSKQLFMPDAQLKTHLVRIYLSHKITMAMQPKLHLIGNDSTAKLDESDDLEYPPLHLATNQTWQQQVSDQTLTCKGTILLFDLKSHPIPWFKAMTRLTPVLSWNEAFADTNQPLVDNKKSVKIKRVVTIGSKEVYLGNFSGALMWTLVIIGSLIAYIFKFVKQSHGSILYLVAQDNNRLSLAKAQIGAWTIAVGGMILGFGLIRLEVPNIPVSILALMGLSLATGGASFYKKETANSMPAHTLAKIKPKLGDLILIYDEQGANPRPSIARAQMVFWTGLVLILFVSKSVLGGVLWQVPWEMVALMGMSQVSYLSPKLFPGFIKKDLDPKGDSTGADQK